MASQKSAGRSGGSTRQGPVRRGSPTARPASSRQGSGKKPSTSGNGAATSRSASAGNGTAAARPAAQRRAASAARPATRTAATAQGRAAAAAEPMTGGPVRRLLRAAWSPFRTMGGLPLATLILSLYGLGASIYLTLAHYDSSVTLVCSGKGLINCEEVTTSPESMLFGVIPVALAGLLFYIFMVAINSPWGWRLQHLPVVRWLRIGSVVAGMAFVLYLIYAELIEIRAICLWCTSVHVATFLIFALLVFHYVFTWEPRSAPSQD
jgi:uncharacterized membrane protein